MMLPEHVGMLRDWIENNEKVEKPLLNDFELELISDEIGRAYKSKSTIRLTYWRDGYLKDDYGIVIEINATSKTIVIDDPFGTNRYKFDEIVAVTLID